MRILFYSCRRIADWELGHYTKLIDLTIDCDKEEARQIEVCLREVPTVGYIQVII